jgi:hypothetical protein
MSPTEKDMDTGSVNAMAADSRCPKLAEEILDAEKARTDLLRWKLFIVASLGAAGLGLMEKYAAFPLLLALIPLVCLYVDLLCDNLNMRILVIAAYFRRCGNGYERFAADCGSKGVFKLEEWAILWSTVVLSFMIGLFGLSNLIKDGAGQLPASSSCSTHPLSCSPIAADYLLIGAGLIGIIGAILLKITVTRCIKKIGTASPVPDA